MEIDGEEDDDSPTPIAVWSELVEQDWSSQIDTDFMHRVQTCATPGDEGNTTYQIPGIFDDLCTGTLQMDNQFLINLDTVVTDPVAAKPSYADLSKDMNLHHKYIIISEQQSQGCLTLGKGQSKHIFSHPLMEELNIQTEVKPTMKNLNSKLLKFVQGSDILEKEMALPDFDKKHR